jgi:hypothetical protein
MLVAQPSKQRQPESSQRAAEQAGDSGSGRLDVVELDDCGRVVGKIIAPKGDVVFGHGRGSVYLKRK